jgi:PAS domain S-box-containing protein
MTRSNLAQPAMRDAETLAQRLASPLPAPADAAVIATDMAGRVVHWSSRAADLYGWTAQEALGRDVVELTPAVQSRQEATAIMVALQAGRSWEGEIVLRRKGGAPFRAWVADFPVGGQGIEAIVGVSLPVDRGAEIRKARAAIEAELGRRFG